MREDPTSMLHLYRRLLTLRRQVRALHAGELELLDTPDGVVGYDRVDGDDRWRVLVNFTSEQVPMSELMTGWLVEVMSGAANGRTALPALSPDEAVVLRRS
jgi:glycosidase